MTDNGAQRPAHELLAQLRAQYPDAPFLALGQTVFWDEPVKAVLRCLLDENGLGGQMTLGVHDTDYFAKARVGSPGRGKFVLMPHNDGTTRDLWSAAGEVSTLFGSETFPSRHAFAQRGVAFEQVANVHPQGRQAFLDAMTEAWGWRGLVYTGSRDLIVNRLSLREVGDGILEMLVWGFDNALKQIVPGCCQREAQTVGDMILQWCRYYRAQSPDATLSDLYQHLLPSIYTLLLGSEPANISVSCTTKLLHFSPETASLPRFRLVDAFLNPATRAIAAAAYNDALAGSEIYDLDKFGAGALPFDVITPQFGRGTLRVTPRVVFVETRQPTAIGLKKPIESVQELAEVLTAKLGRQVTLVGKAVTLVSMLASEYIFVFNEEGSLYVRRTRQMNDVLARHGIALDLKPILRMRYHTWDALAVAGSTLCPTEHLAAAFGRATITTPELAACWRSVVEEQRALCETIAHLRKPLELIAYLRDRDPVAPWDTLRADYEQAKQTLTALREQAIVLHRQTKERLAEHRVLRARTSAVQQAQGEHFRATSLWTPDATAQRQAFDRELRDLADRKRAVCAEVVALKSRRWHIERGPEATEARAALARVVGEAELARLRLVRNALLTIEGMTHTNHRPSFWWLPMVDSSGGWFRRIVATTELYTEPLLS